MRATAGDLEWPTVIAAVEPADTRPAYLDLGTTVPSVPEVVRIDKGLVTNDR